jgi:NAD(P)-dependent dehydrogenase (short-subunit alcohol dehydrogenase family)
VTLALVTGASRGIGREIARQLVARGCRVLAGVRDPALAPAGAEPLRLDVADAESVLAAADTVKGMGVKLDLLVNNAGILLDEGRALLDLEEDLVRETLETNTLGPLRMAQAFVPLMGKGGRIVNVSSAGGQLSSMGTWAPAYCISKTALNAVTVQLANALKAKGIAVNSMCPGWVRTDMGGAGAPKSVADGADTALWLCLEAPAALTGRFIQERREIPW